MDSRRVVAAAMMLVYFGVTQVARLVRSLMSSSWAFVVVYGCCLCAVYDTFVEGLAVDIGKGRPLCQGGVDMLSEAFSKVFAADERRGGVEEAKL